VDSANDAIVSATLDGVITSWNAAAERMYGYTAAEIVGRSTSLLIPPETAPGLMPVLERVRQGDTLGEEGRDYAQKIEAASEHTGEILDDLLANAWKFTSGRDLATATPGPRAWLVMAPPSSSPRRPQSRPGHRVSEDHSAPAVTRGRGACRRGIR
jgi:PAS domain-containing protein